MMERCPECGKRHVVMWPELHPFRRGELFYCSHGCWEISLQRDLKIIKDIARKRRVKKVNGKLTVDQKARAVEIALAGESPLPYLKEIGMKNPSASWQYIKSVLKNTNPDRWAQLPGRLPKNIETPEGGITGPVTISAEDVGALVVDDTVVKIDKPRTVGKTAKTVGQTVSTYFTTNPDFSHTFSTSPMPETRPVEAGDDFECSVIRSKKTGARYEKFEGSLCMKIGMDELVLDVDTWRALLNEIPVAARKLGVEL